MKDKKSSQIQPISLVYWILKWPKSLITVIQKTFQRAKSNIGLGRLIVWANINGVPHLAWVEDKKHPNGGYWRGLPRDKDKLRNLTELNIWGNHLTSLPPELGYLQNLTKLYLHENKLRVLPPEIGRLRNLTVLDLRDNQLTRLSSKIGRLRNLNTLDLSGNRFSKISQLRNFTFLGFWNLIKGSSQLTSLPPEIGQLSNLRFLNLSRCQLTSLPPEIGQLSNLTSLNLDENQLTGLPPETRHLNNLTMLRLSNNEITRLPPGIRQLRNLAELSLKWNNLKSLPPEVVQLSNLTKLDLKGNQLTSLPPEIGQLSNLTELNLSWNKLTSLPPEIGRISNLTELNLLYNQLTNLPPEIGQLKNLKSLSLLGNPLTHIPQFVFDLPSLSLFDRNALSKFKETKQEKTSPPFEYDKTKQDVLKERGDGYELHIGRKFELKGDLVIYNGFIRGYEDQGVDVIVIPKVGQEINLIQCKHWKRFEFTEEHLNEIYRKLNTYERDYQMIAPDKINHYLSLKKSDNEITSAIKASLAFHQLRKTLYLSSGQVVQNSVWQQLEKINDRIYRYKDLKVVIHGID